MNRLVPARLAVNLNPHAVAVLVMVREEDAAAPVPEEVNLVVLVVDGEGAEVDLRQRLRGMIR